MVDTAPPDSVVANVDPQSIGGAPATVIGRPDPGTTLIVDVADGQNLSFSFDLKDASVGLSDVDLIITFPDGAKIILLQFGLLSALDSIPPVHFEAAIVPAQDLLA